MRRFSEILLSNERNETNLIAALKNAIYYPSNEEMYVKHFERNDYLKEMPYTITVVEHTLNQELPMLLSILRHRYEQCIVYEEPDRIVLLTIGHSPEHLKRDFSDICRKFTDLHVGIGSLELNLVNLYLSYEHAVTACELVDSVIKKNPLCYDDLGTYQIICNINNPEIVCTPFIKQTLC